MHAFATDCFGFETKNPVIRAVDWRHKWRSEGHLIRSLKNYAKKGVVSRRERFGEIWGRITSGYPKEPQGFIHILSPQGSPPEHSTALENWRTYLHSREARKGEYRHRAYFLIDAPKIQTDTYKKRYLVIPDTTPKAGRVIKALFIRRDGISKDAQNKIEQISGAAGWPVFDIQSLKRVA
ncbi:MAG: hypothetical protein AAB573_01010 [Patescibacteria group bacterium]